MSVRGGSLCIMFKLNTLHPLDRIRGHAQPDMLPTPRPGRVLLPPGAENCTTLWKYSSIPPAVRAGARSSGMPFPGGTAARSLFPDNTAIYLDRYQFERLPLSPNSEMVVTKP